jgi:hypothetical protein
MLGSGRESTLEFHLESRHLELIRLFRATRKTDAPTDAPQRIQGVTLRVFALLVVVLGSSFGLVAPTSAGVEVAQGVGGRERSRAQA